MHARKGATRADDAQCLEESAKRDRFPNIQLLWMFLRRRRSACPSRPFTAQTSTPTTTRGTQCHAYAQSTGSPSDGIAPCIINAPLDQQAMIYDASGGASASGSNDVR
jgi:hypothetical protein